MQDYEVKGNAYFSHARTEVAPVLPKDAHRILEVGCGAGATLAWLGGRYPEARTFGLELSPTAAVAARACAHEVWCGDVEREVWGQGWPTFDLILCLDVLEHLVDPWRMVDHLVETRLEPGGVLVVSLPNVRHYSVVLPLLFRGRWDYADAGLLDRTHLRFFTRRSALALLSHPKLEQTQYPLIGFHGKPLKRVLDWLTFGLFRELVTYQHWIVARKVTQTPAGA